MGYDGRDTGAKNLAATTLVAGKRTQKADAKAERRDPVVRGEDLSSVFATSAFCLLPSAFFSLLAEWLGNSRLHSQSSTVFADLQIPVRLTRHPFSPRLKLTQSIMLNN